MNPQSAINLQSAIRHLQFHGSIVASSISMTGMSSLIGYTRLHVSHFSAVPFLTSVTGVLQFGQARISSSSGSTAIDGNI